MQVNVIHSGSVESLDYLLFPEQNHMNQQYIYNQLSNFSNNLTDVGRKFVEASKAIYDKVNDSNAIRAAKAALRMAKGLFHPNMIVSLDSLDDVRAAQPVMQRYIMANPEIRSLYFQQKCDGYVDTYIDQEPNKIGNDHYDYRRVMNGIVNEVINDNSEYEWSVTNFYETLHEGDRELTFDERCNILKTWSVVDMFIQAGQDPTNIFGSTL